MPTSKPEAALRERDDGKPQGRECLPHPEFLAWHRAEVFKEPARE